MGGLEEPGERGACELARCALNLLLGLPCRETPDVDVIPVQSWLSAVTGELNLELHLISGHGRAAKVRAMEERRDLRDLLIEGLEMVLREKRGK